MSIRTFGQPVAKPAMRYSPAHRAFISGEVRDAREANLVYRGASPWSAPCFAVPKPRSTDLRLVLDYRFLNSQTVRDSYPLPNLADVVDRLGPH